MPVKSILKKIIPKSFFGIYHKGLAIAANIFYRFPSAKLIVIAVTGTNGKTTTCNLIWQILTTAGHKVGLTTSINFKIGSKEWVNRTKQGMPGRFKLPKLLRQMVKAGCQYAVIETTSEGVAQYRHWGIFYEVAVFTNLTPEHIESHGSFKKYRTAKGQLFKMLKEKKGLMISLCAPLVAKKHTKKTSVVNLDDKNAEYFLKFSADEKWGITIQSAKCKNHELLNQLSIINYQLSSQGTNFDIKINDHFHIDQFKTNLLGEFNIYNCLSAIAVGVSQDVDIKVIQSALAQISGVPGRMEFIDCGQNFKVIVDYAHDPAALENVYQTIRKVISRSFSPGQEKLIAVLGAVGGGRDTAKRPILGALASKYADYVILTNEDPYDDDPREIIEQVEPGLKKDPKRVLDKNYWKILDRGKAIKKALSLAEKDDVVAITGKGCEEVMAVRGGFVPWDDRAVVKKILSPHFKRNNSLAL